MIDYEKAKLDYFFDKSEEIMPEIGEKTLNKIIPKGSPLYKTLVHDEILHATTREEEEEIMKRRKYEEALKLFNPEPTQVVQTFENIKEGMNNNINLNNTEYDILKRRKNVFHTQNPNYQSECETHAITNWNELVIDKEEGIKKRFEAMTASIIANINSIKENDLIKNVNETGINKEYNAIKNKVNTYKQNLFMDSRKNMYSNKNLLFYNQIYFYLLIIYYSLFVLYLIFSDFIDEKKYFILKNVLILLLYLIFPYILKYILIFIYKSYIFIIEYYNLKNDPISYADLIEEKEKYDYYY